MRIALAAVVVSAVASGTSAHFAAVAVNVSSAPDVDRQLRAQATCNVENDVDYSGSDVGNARGAASDCCNMCSARGDCGAFTWTSYNGGTCWLKSSKGSAKTSSGATSGVVSTTPGCSLEPGVDYTGNDIGSVLGSAADCCGKCSARSGCGAFTWSDYNGGTCWLKSGKGAAVGKTGVTSGVVTSSSLPSCSSVEQNVDYIGNDIGSVAGSGAADCCSKCSSRSGCGAFTWSNFNGGTCWLKSGKGASKGQSGVVSGVVIPSATSGHVQTRLRSGEIPIRSVNLGGWLMAEYWMSFTSPAWKDTNGVGSDGEYLTMKALGKAKGTAQFEEHRATWITETDIQQIVAAGLNTVRVPVGFWIVNDDPSVPSTDITRVFAAGALKYLDTLVNDWAVKYNFAVMLSLHAHQGSQNGYDHSSPQVKGTTSWSSSQANVDNSLQFATYLANRYKNSVAFLGMNLMNEPAFPTDYNVLWGYYKEAYRRIRATGNNCVLVVSPMIQDQLPPVMMNFMRWPEYTNVWHEFHVYYRWGYEHENEYRILDAARSYRSNHLDKWSGNNVYIGEWSLTHPDEVPFTNRDLLKEFAAIQLKNYEGAHAGWGFWSWRHDEELSKLSAWSMRQLLREGIFTVPRVN